MLQLPLHKVLQPRSKPIIFCYDSVLSFETSVHFWDSLDISFITSKPEQLEVHYGNSSHEIFSAAHHNASTPLRLIPFGIHCVGVRYSMETFGDDEDIPFDLDAKLVFWYWNPILLCIGLALLHLAPRMSRLINIYNGTSE